MIPDPRALQIAQARRRLIDEVGHVLDQDGLDAIDALIAAALSPAAGPPSLTPMQVLALLDDRIRAQFTPALNTGTALEMGILVAEAIRALQAEVTTPETETP